MTPFARRRNDVVMRHEKNVARRVASLNFIDPAVLAEISYLSALVQQRKQLFDTGAQTGKLSVVVHVA